MQNELSGEATSKSMSERLGCAYMCVPTLHASCVSANIVVVWRNEAGLRVVQGAVGLHIRSVQTTKLVLAALCRDPGCRWAVDGRDSYLVFADSSRATGRTIAATP